MNVKNVYQKGNNSVFDADFISIEYIIHCNFLWKNKNFKNVLKLKGYFQCIFTRMTTIGILRLT